jgi:hypothetical protein
MMLLSIEPIITAARIVRMKIIAVLAVKVSVYKYYSITRN